MHHRLCFFTIALALALGGCSTGGTYQKWQPHLQAQQAVAELKAVPFYPQETYQCGPAALATVISAAGVAIEPHELTAQLFIKGRKGSLQIEMLAATRRQGLVPYPNSGGLAHLLQQLRNGVPVVVLQNLAFSWAPTWHYAVVVGYDAARDEFLLRSGEERLRRTHSREFARTWDYSGQWMMTVHQPGDVPAGADALAYVRAANGLERVDQLQAALRSYRAASERWPESGVAWMALGNGHYQAGQFEHAEDAYRRAQQLNPRDPAAAHNLAWALIRQGKAKQALAPAQAAVRLSDQPRYHSALQALL